MNARFEALAFRVWAVCQAREWSCTAREVADELGISVRQVVSVLAHKRWGGRLPTDCATSSADHGLSSSQGVNITDARHVIREIAGHREVFSE